VTKRDNEWLNGFNKWFSLMLRSNHDCQYLFTKNQTLAVIYYIMKYISKQESSLHSKLTIAAAVRKAMDPSSTASDAAKSLLIKIYNKISSHREVSIPEMIAHMLGYPERFTSGIFENINTTHLIVYMNRMVAKHQEKPVETTQPADNNSTATFPSSVDLTHEEDQISHLSQPSNE
jgi:hypothetical protein